MYFFKQLLSIVSNVLKHDVKISFVNDNNKLRGHDCLRYWNWVFSLYLIVHLLALNFTSCFSALLTQ